MLNVNTKKSLAFYFRLDEQLIVPVFYKITTFTRMNLNKKRIIVLFKAAIIVSTHTTFIREKIKVKRVGFEPTPPKRSRP